MKPGLGTAVVATGAANTARWHHPHRNYVGGSGGAR